MAKWYTELKRDESETIFGSDSPSESMASENEQNIVLQQQIDGLLNQLTEKTELLQQVIEQNKILQQEVDLLRARIAQKIGIVTA